MKDIKKAAFYGGLVAAGTVVGLACYVYHLGKKTDTKKIVHEYVYPKMEDLNKKVAETESVNNDEK